VKEPAPSRAELQDPITTDWSSITVVLIGFLSHEGIFQFRVTALNFQGRSLDSSQWQVFFAH
jgi:hypothetical protein